MASNIITRTRTNQELPEEAEVQPVNATTEAPTEVTANNSAPRDAHPTGIPCNWDHLDLGS